MKHLILTCLATITFQSCQLSLWISKRNLCNDEIVNTKKINFPKSEGSSFLYPELVNKINSKHSLSFLIRKENLETSELTSDVKTDITSLQWALEKALINEQHTVVDPAIYEIWKSNNKERKPKFDYIIEIMEAYSTSYSTGIHNRYLEGIQLTIKIINPISGQTVGILKKATVPCTSGCEIKYTECLITEEITLPRKIGYPKNFISKGFSINDLTQLVKSIRTIAKN